jgi:hypothetical protein
MSPDLLLHWFDKELGYLRRPQLVPREGGFGASGNDYSDRMGDAIHWQSVYGTMSANPWSSRTSHFTFPGRCHTQMRGRE